MVNKIAAVAVIALVSLPLTGTAQAISHIDKPKSESLYKKADSKKKLKKPTKQIQLVPGPQGDRGETGPQGPKGDSITGPAGPAGSVGPAGAVGPQGLQGIAGLNGKDGSPGRDGKDGLSLPSGTVILMNGSCPAGFTMQGDQNRWTVYANDTNGRPWTTTVSSAQLFLSACSVN